MLSDEGTNVLTFEMLPYEKKDYFTTLKEQQHLHEAAGTISREVLLTAISEQEHWAPGTKS